MNPINKMSGNLCSVCRTIISSEPGNNLMCPKCQEKSLEILKESYPNARHTICSDNDYFKWKERTEDGDEKAENVGLKSALLLREEYGVGVIFPIFPKGHNGSDWNDLLVDFSLELAREQFEYQWEYMDHHETIVFDDESIMSDLAGKLECMA